MPLPGDDQQTAQVQRDFRAAISTWRKCANHLESLLADTEDINSLKRGRDELTEAMNHLEKTQGKLEDLVGPDPSAAERYENADQENYQLIKKACRRIIHLTTGDEDTRSTVSSRSHASRQSSSSKRSSIPDRATIATEAAAIRAKLKFADLEAKKRAELELKKAELDKVSSLKELRVAEATLEAIDKEQHEYFDSTHLTEVPRQMGANAYVEAYLESNANSVPRDKGSPPNLNTSAEKLASMEGCPSVHEHNQTTIEVDNSPPSSPTLNPFADDFKPEGILLNAKQSATMVNPTPTTSVENICENHENLQSNESHLMTSPQTATPAAQMSSLADCLAKQFSINRLPPPEPGVFTGDPLKYPSWKGAFEGLIEKGGVSPVEKLHYLKKYVGGAARQAIDGYFFLTTEDAFNQAKQLLERRYGDPFVIGNAFRDKLDSWPRIPPRDGKALRDLADFMKQCEAAMETVNSLNVLNDEREHRKVLSKLPDWLVSGWARKAADKKEQQGRYPSFSELSKYIDREASIACDPVTSLQGLRGSEKRSESYDNRHKSDRKRPPGASTLFTKTSDNVPSKTQKSAYCFFCTKDHHLDVCKLFISKTLEERKGFAMKKGLCFGCLARGHLSKDCKNRLKCKTCSKPHPTALHGDVRVKPDSSAKDATSSAVQELKSVTSNTRISLFSGSDNGCKSSMTVPVWISHKDNPKDERLVYALLDTQSDTTFILQDTCNALGLHGTEVQLLLSTMFAQDQRVLSHKVDGLMVRGYDSQLKIALPAAYTRDVMPANRSHIPTAEMARKWPHLTRIADQLMPVSDCEVGILIGYNCPRALAPREVIAPVDNEPYGQRTDLGWGIIGIVNPSLVEDQCDAIGTSHRVLACEVAPLLKSNREPGAAALQDQVLLSFRTRVKEIINPSQITDMMELDFSERATNDAPLSQDDLSFMKQMKDGVRQHSDGHFIMPLPFRGAKEPQLSNNKSQAFHRLQQLKARFKKSQRYHEDYCVFMGKILNNGYAEEVAASEQMSDGNGHVWYIPHHGVYHPKKPDKIRVVFDCSARCNGDSLNDHLLQGPDLINTLVGVLCRFRREPVAFMCDVEQMFFQFKVAKEHRDFLRFLWWVNGDYNDKPAVFRMNVHLFGATSSPGCANFGLKQIANNYEAELGSEAANFVRQDFYVDDGLTSLPTTDEAINLIKKTRELCSRGGLRLHKFVSNSKAVINAVAPEDRAQSIKDLDLRHDILPIERALGVQWCIESDTFQFRINLADKPLTRRGVLSTISSVYDPLGFVAPCLLVGKQILQSLCRTEAGWDDPLPDALRTRWEQWRSDLLHLEKLKVQRCFHPTDFGEVQTIELHHFSDASNVGYAQCSYVRLSDNQGRVHCSLVMGKCRVCPLKVVTIPRLELNAAVVSVRVSALLQRELNFSNCTEVFWTDSQVVLAYVANDSRKFHVFVANRVQEIRNHTKPSQWRHVATDVNPADDGSRGLSVTELVNKSKWLSGPQFLWEKEIPIVIEANPPTVSADDPEVKRVQAFAVQQFKNQSLLDRLEHFSDWHRAKRAVAACLRLKSNFKDRSIKKPSEPLSIEYLRKNAIPLYESATVKELQQAELEIIRQVQSEVFKEEIKILQRLDVNDTNNADRNVAKRRNQFVKKSSSLYRLDPFIDADGILRVGGRIRKAQLPLRLKHPAILPRKHHVSSLVIQHCHQETAHQGRGMTTNQLRASGFWIIGCSSAVSQFISQCVKCKKLYGRAQEQKMADLPEDRLQPAPPFTYCGVDVFGPWYIKQGRKELKRYGILFTCMASRGIHIETSASLSTDSFINALRRFISIRGPIQQLRSDRGTNFVGAQSELRSALAEMDHDSIRQFLVKEGCDYFKFEMNVPTASHAGGVWERQIRSVRRVLATLMDQAGTQLDDESLRTLMCEAAAIVNSRPLTVANLNEPTAPEPLTPNHLLTMKSKVILPPPGVFQRSDMYSRKRWRRVQYLTNEFWNRWRKEVIQTLQSRQKWSRSCPNINIGDIVLIVDDNLPRNEWQLGRVSATVQSSDGRVRAVKLAIADSHLDALGKQMRPTRHLERPIQKLVLLLKSEETRDIPLEEP